MSRKKIRKHNSSRLKRSHSLREPRPIFYIFCEGKRTEPDYFRALVNSLSPKSTVNLNFPYTGAVPHTIAKKAVEFQKSNSQSKRRARSSNKNDQVWAVFDRDEHPNFDEAVRLCRENGVLIGRSNPCFEVWLILHLGEYGTKDNSQKVKKRYRQLLKIKTNWEKLNHNHKFLESVKAAESRAIKQMELRRQEGDEFEIPSTTIGQLTVAIRETHEHYLNKSHSKS